ncbi:uncharacterized protein LOC142318950 isoform X2 [Lycorma delicatula]
MGWQKGQGLGANNQGITERIKVPYKFDSTGLGFKEKDELSKQQSDFQSLLSHLNSNEMKVTSDEPSMSSLEEKSKKLKSRVHYQKFTRGKDISRYSSKDLSSILGTVVTVKTSETNGSKNENNSGNLICGGLMTKYFKKKQITTETQSRLDKQYKITDVEGIYENHFARDFNGNNLNSIKKKGKSVKNKETLITETHDVKINIDVSEIDMSLENVNETNESNSYVTNDLAFYNLLSNSANYKKQRKKLNKLKENSDAIEKYQVMSNDTVINVGKSFESESEMQSLSKKDNGLGYDSNLNLQGEKCDSIIMEEDKCYRIPIEIINCKSKKHKSKKKKNNEHNIESEINESNQNSEDFVDLKVDNSFLEKNTNLESCENDSYSRKKKKLKYLEEESFSDQHSVECKKKNGENIKSEMLNSDQENTSESFVKLSSKKSKKKKKSKFHNIENEVEHSINSESEKIESLTTFEKEENKSSQNKKSKVKKCERLLKNISVDDEQHHGNEENNSYCLNEGSENYDHMNKFYSGKSKEKYQQIEGKFHNRLLKKENGEHSVENHFGNNSIKSNCSDKSKKRKHSLIEDVIVGENQAVERNVIGLQCKHEKKKKKKDVSDINENLGCGNASDYIHSEKEQRVTLNEENFTNITTQEDLQNKHVTEVQEKKNNALKGDCFNSNDVFERKLINKEFKKKAVPEFDAFVGSNWKSVDGYGIVNNKENSSL